MYFDKKEFKWQMLKQSPNQGENMVIALLKWSVMGIAVIPLCCYCWRYGKKRD